MVNLRDVSEGAIDPIILQAIKHNVLREVRSYAAARKHDQERGLETPWIAAVLVEQYVRGMANTLEIAGLDASDVIPLGDKVVREIDPDFEVHRNQRWAFRPATISQG